MYLTDHALGLVLKKPRHKHSTEDCNVEDGHAASSGTLFCDQRRLRVTDKFLSASAGW